MYQILFYQDEEIRAFAVKANGGLFLLSLVDHNFQRKQETEASFFGWINAKISLKIYVTGNKGLGVSLFGIMALVGIELCVQHENICRRPQSN